MNLSTDPSTRTNGLYLGRKDIGMTIRTTNLVTAIEPAPTEKTVKAYMTREYQDHIDPICGDLNLTGMVEDALQHFPTLDGTHGAPVWDWAVEVEQRLVRLGCAQPIIREA